MTLKYTLVKYTDNNVRENKCVCSASETVIKTV